jgi:hypothetical protein
MDLSSFLIVVAILGVIVVFVWSWVFIETVRKQIQYGEDLPKRKERKHGPK